MFRTCIERLLEKSKVLRIQDNENFEDEITFLIEGHPLYALIKIDSVCLRSFRFQSYFKKSKCSVRLFMIQ